MKTSTYIISFIRIFGLFGLALILSAECFGQSIGTEEALEIGREFLDKKSGSLRSTDPDELELGYVHYADGVTSSLRSADEPLFYIFNRPKANQFVIVSGEAGTTSVLGYSLEGTFPSERIPESIQSWLDTYGAEICHYQQMHPLSGILAEQNDEIESFPADTVFDSSGLTEEVFVAPSSDMELRSLPSSVKPLIKTKWGQGAPYNAMTPKDGSSRSLTGCMATALAQIMYYHQWPIQGKGQKSYVTKTRRFSVSANFGSTSYDWKMMKTDYNSSYSTAEANAVATLMQHAGVAVSMDYTKNGSFANSETSRDALINYFKYNKNIQLVCKNYYSSTDWTRMVKEQLNKKLPVWYRGDDSKVGHAFVIDGYDSDDYFHVNWGWDGDCNGYFKLSTLRPYSSSVGFPYDQMMLLNVQPTTSGESTRQSKLALHAVSGKTIWADTEATLSRSSPIKVHMNCKNIGNASFNGKIGAAIKLSSDRIHILYAMDSSLQTDYYQTYCFFNTLPASFANGTYRIYGVYKPNGSSLWYYMDAPVNRAEYVNLKVTGSTVTLSNQRVASNKEEEPEEEREKVFNLTVSKKVTCTDPIEQGQAVSFSASVKNTGDAYYYGKLGVYLVSSSDHRKTQLIMNSYSSFVSSSETKSYDVSGTIKLDPGIYTVYPAYEKDNGTLFLNSGTVITVKAPQPKVYNLVVIDKPKSTTKTIQGQTSTFAVKLKNTGDAAYSGKLGVLLQSSAMSSKKQAILSSFDYFVGAGKEKSYTVTGKITVEPGTYTVYPVFEQEEKTTTLKSGTTVTVESSKPLTPKLSIAQSIKTDSEVIKGNTTLFTYKVKNEGDGDYYDKLGVQLMSMADNSKQQTFLSSYNLAVKAGETKEIQISGKVTMADGSYRAYIVTMQDGKSKTLLPGVTVKVVTPKPKEFKLSAKQKVSFSGKLCTNGLVYCKTAVKNSGDGVYKNLLGVVFVSSQDASVTQEILSGFDYYIRSGGETNVTVYGTLDLPTGNYRVYPIYYKDGKQIRLYEGAASVTIGESGFKLYPQKKVEPVGSLWRQHTSLFSIGIENKGAESFKGRVGACLYSEKKKQVILSESDYYISAGSSWNCLVSGIVSLPVGTYTAYPVCESGGELIEFKDYTSTVTVTDFPSAIQPMDQERPGIKLDVWAGMLCVELKQIQQIRLLDFTGRCVFSYTLQPADQVMCNISHLPHGNYIVEVTTVDHQIVEKINW